MGAMKEAGIECAPRRYKDIIDRQIIRDSRLSLRALGVAVRLLSNAEGFKMTSLDLARERPEGRDAVRGALKELEEFGYLRRTRTQLHNGHWVTTVVISDELQPTPESPSSVVKHQSPAPENPSSVVKRQSPTPENPSSAVQPENPTPEKPIVGHGGDKSSKSTTSKFNNNTNTPDDLVWPPALTAAQAEVVGNVIQGLDRAKQQILLDELAGALRSPNPPRQLSSWMYALRARQKNGLFIPNLGLAVEQERIRRAGEAVAQQERNQARVRAKSPEEQARKVAASLKACADIRQILRGSECELRSAAAQS